MRQLSNHRTTLLGSLVSKPPSTLRERLARETIYSAVPFFFPLSRFLINIPDEDKDDPVKLCSHVELAYWFYLDLQRPEDPSLPACSMKEFMATSILVCMPCVVCVCVTMVICLLVYSLSIEPSTSLWCSLSCELTGSLVSADP